ncbi:hypothetical protein [Desulfosporosinus sp. FKA]|uniref:hypothetical protein n=1 Tax=Desulfosporosinus sp. FKA TaxID=1969834 RepID=UPI000B498488|nr:hypothetical protein [Desulfosporosinus sp. FKA]
MKTIGYKTMAVTAATGCLLLSLSATTLANTGSGYADYKAALTTAMLTKNATINAQYEVQDNGVIILSGKSLKKMDNKNESSKTSIIVDGITQTYETSEANGNYLTEANGKYFSGKKSEEKSKFDSRENLTASSSTVKLAGILADTLVGDVKNQFVENGQTISVKLEGAQIPELARLAISAAAERSNQAEDLNANDLQGKDAILKPVLAKMPKLNNIDIKSLAMTATVNGSTLEANSFTIAITGNDVKGVSHELDMNLNTKITNVGNTQIDTINTTGQQVTTIN